MATSVMMNNSSKGSSRGNLSRDEWQRRYDSGETGWDRGTFSPALRRWLADRVLTPCSIFVPGCGRGHEVVELARRRFAVTALDFARSPVRQLTKQLTQANLVADVLREDVLRFAPSDPFDAIYEQTCLCAIHPKHWRSYETRLASNLRPGGRLFALWMQSNKSAGPPYHCGLEAMGELFCKSRWLWPQDSFIIQHPAGMDEIAVVLQRKERA